jgi:hypothetical protein
MRKRHKILLAGVACAGLTLFLVVAAVLSAHLLANRQIVKAFLVRQAAKSAGARLDYDRLDLNFYPLPHLKASNLKLHRNRDLSIKAQSLSIYPRLLPLIKGKIRIRRLYLAVPDIKMHRIDAPSDPPPQHVAARDAMIADQLRALMAGIFAFAAAVDSDTQWEISQGMLTLSTTGKPDFRINGVDAHGAKVNDILSINLDCRFDVAGELTFQVSVDPGIHQADGEITISDLNVRRLLQSAALPGDITTSDTAASATISFHVHATDSVQGRFDLNVPAMTVRRQGLQLALDQAAVAGSFQYANRNVSISVETLRARDPQINLTAKAAISPEPASGGLRLEIHAAATQLDVGIANTVTRAIAGDLKPIQTAFDVAREGQLADATYFAGFGVDDTGWHLTGMRASGHLSQGLVTIPGINADIERLDGDVVFENQHVNFKNVSGHFKGVTFKKLVAAIDWEATPALSIATPEAKVDTAALHTWLTTFKALSGTKKYLESINGVAELSNLTISGPLTKPAAWAYAITGTPKDLRINSPLFPFELKSSGGEINYIPGDERAKDVTLDFLDASLVVSYQSRGLVDPESVNVHIDGSLGEDATAWLGEMVSIPDHLSIKAPIEVDNAHVSWNSNQTIAFAGGVKTAGGVTLFTDLTHSPKGWHIRELRFSDGRSRVDASARLSAPAIDLTFSGNIEKQTADRLLRDNRSLRGRLEGDFRIKFDVHAPLNTTFDGRLSGDGLLLHRLISEPIEVRRFALDGSGSQLSISSSQVHLLNSRMNIDGVLSRGIAGLTFDLNVHADRVDDALIHVLTTSGKSETKPTGKPDSPLYATVQGDIHLITDEFTFDTYTWSPVEADIHLEGNRFKAVVNKANLCGISTTGVIQYSPRGLAFTIAPKANSADLQKTYYCLWNLPVKADATYELSGTIKLPTTRQNPLTLLSGNLEYLSTNGNIMYTNTLIKIIHYLNASGLFSGGKDGLAYKTAKISAEIGGGDLRLNEILIDGQAMKITGQGRIELESAAADITLLVAPLRRVGRVVDLIPGMNLLTGGSLISFPLHVEGPLKDLKIAPLPPAAVGKGVLNAMKRILKAPSKMIEGSADWVSEETSKTVPAETEPEQRSP